MDNALDGAWIAPGPVETQRRSPVVHDECHALLQSERIEEPVQIAPVLSERVRTRIGVGQLSGVAHADQIGRYAATELLHVGNDISPQKGRRGVTVKEDDRISRADVMIGDR